jgi:two-component system LytT family response regulator
MTEFSCVIVDDESLARDQMSHILAQIPSVKVVGEAASTQAALEVIRLKNPDLVFLDIQLRGASGFDVVREIPDLSVIFTTAHEQYAARSYDIDAVDYLLKPISFERVKRAVEKFCRTFGSQQAIREKASEPSRLIPVGGRADFILPEKILYIKSEGHHTSVMTDDSGIKTVRYPLKEWLGLLPSSDFQQIGRGLIINLPRISHVANHNSTGLLSFTHSSHKLSIGSAASKKLREVLQKCRSSCDTFKGPRVVDDV